MEDNKQKENTPAGTPPADKPATETPAPTPTVGPKPTTETPTTTPTAGPKPADFGAAGVDDINRNVGSFVNPQYGPQQAPSTADLKLDVDSSVIEKASKEEINFERFGKTKKERKHKDLNQSKTRLGEKISMMLRSKKGLRTTWILEMVFMAVIIIISSCLIAFLHPYVKDTKGVIYLLCGPVTKAGYVFFWISLFPCLVPLIYLLTTWFIGINQVASSKLFHIFFWATAAFSLLCFILGLCLSARAFDLISHMGKAVRSVLAIL